MVCTTATQYINLLHPYYIRDQITLTYCMYMANKQYFWPIPSYFVTVEINFHFTVHTV